MDKNYTPNPMDTTQVKLPDELNELVDYLACNAHEVWAKGRIASGVTYGESTDDTEKKNCFLKPYDCLTPAEKLTDINSVEETVKFIINSGYKIEKVDETHWQTVERKYFKRYHHDKQIPIYKAPFVIGLVGDVCSQLSTARISECIDSFVEHITEQLGNKKGEKDNGKRQTPLYIISEFANSSEIVASEYAFKEHGIELISVNNPDVVIGNCKIKNITVQEDACGYITNNSFMLLSLWDGMTKESRAGCAVRNALLEYDATRPESTAINDSNAVYHIVLPGNTDSRFHWKTRLLLPYILESGQNWYTLRDASIEKSPDTKEEVIMGLTAATLANGSIKKIIKDDISAIKIKYQKDKKALLAENSKAARKKQLEQAENKALSENERNHILRLMKDEDKAFKKKKKALSDSRKKAIKRAKYKKKYNHALEESKKDRYDSNCKMVGYINASIDMGAKIKKTPNEYDLLNTDTHGKSLSADAVNLRHLRLDTIATAFQDTKKRQTMLIALFAAIGLASYGVFSDLASPRSVIGVIGGLLSAFFIFAALVLFLLNQHKKYHSNHLNIRLLSEILRVKTYLNAAGIYDVDASELLSERQKQDLEWAQMICRGWTVVDKADGYYDSNCQKYISADKIRKMWIGSADNLLTSDKSKVYVPSAGNGQMDFDRGRGNEYLKKARGLNFWKTFATVCVVVATLAITIYAFFNYLGNAGNVTFSNWQDLLAEQFTAGTFATIFEAIAVFIIGIVPSVIGCALIYHESQMYTENALRYRWMAVKYQKITACLDNGLLTNVSEDTPPDADTEAKIRSVFTDAALTAVQEIGEWTALTSNNDISLPF